MLVILNLISSLYNFNNEVSCMGMREKFPLTFEYVAW